MTSRGQDNSRVKGFSLVKPFVYGNIARQLEGDKVEEARTHEWTLYLKPYFNEDFSNFIKKVQFKLHDSYQNNVRDVVEPPYEVHETGWGEFEASIKIFPIDSAEKPIVLYHIIRLFPLNAELVTQDNSIVSEYYDEMVIFEPTGSIYRALQPTLSVEYEALPHHYDCFYFSNIGTSRITEIKNKLNEDIINVSNELESGKSYLKSLKEKILKLQNILQNEPSASTVEDPVPQPQQ
ncbi:YEATS domain-containing protein 4 [Thelohanellus kitauei]|uniref:YEATS domain-containing protein 4 n=1 Tax=Thelohanellus kitauei TaxID=669202 RepID=A0A0C2MY49_THEKT|nr:YEATS domain-containing protein 4 [Thelohanellus kitauei]